MGCFSWRFANNGNKKRLRIGCPGYLLCPNETVLAERCYEGYGLFAHQDAFDLVAEWNREYLSKHPEFVIPRRGKRVDSYPWYPYYADMSKSKEDVEIALMAAGVPAAFAEFRSIGITIACYDEDNAALPYPIKVCSSRRPRLSYADLPASEMDSDQGF